MIGRRRPLLRGAMIGGAGYMAGKSAARGQQRESEQEMRLQALESQQAPPPAAAPAPAGDDLASKLAQLAQLQQSGVLTAEEFAAAKAKLLAE
ncbi:MAG TPA: SHOCT domain-containing protein [Gaiellaceae bacterium]|nr:SHOCT domain-containing protein [Gaiellaceae bacterium]